MKRRIEVEAARLVDVLALEGLNRERAAQHVRMFLDRAGLMKESKSDALAHPEIPDILAFYNEQYRGLIGEFPIYNWAEAAGIVTRLLRMSTATVIRQRLYSYFHGSSEYVRASGYPWPLFVTEWNRLATAESRERPWREDCHVRQHNPPCKTPWEHGTRNARGE